MRVLVEGASATFDSFRRHWTLRLSVRGPFKTNLEMGPQEWPELLPHLKGRVRHAPITEDDARYAERVVEDILRERPGSLAIRTSKMGNINVANWGWKERGEEKPTREEKRMSDAVDRRKLTLKMTVSKGTRTQARCEWDIERLGTALMEGLVPKDMEGAEAIIGAKVQTYREEMVDREEEQPDGTLKTVKKKMRVPVWDEADVPPGPFDGDLPDPKNGASEHIAFIPEVRDLFRKAKGGAPFEVMDFGESEIVLYCHDGYDLKVAKKWIAESAERLPWVSDWKGAKLEAKAFEK